MPAWAKFLAVLAAVVFLLLGSRNIAHPGLQYDEMLFVHATYPDPQRFGSWHTGIFGDPVCVMIMPYIGALKGWIYHPILSVFPASAATARIPALLLGAATVGLLFLFALRAFDWKVALATVWLTATDPLFVLTTRLDWGPVVIQRLCLVAGCLFVVRWAHRGGAWALATGFLIFGFGIFDKATFLFLIAALALSAACTFPKELIRRAHPRTIAVALVALAIGSLPFWWFHTVRAPGSSLGLKITTDPEQYVGKYLMLRHSLDGTALTWWLSHEPGPTSPSAPDSFLWGLLSGVASGEVSRTLTVPALVAALLLLPVTLRSGHGRGILFALLFCVCSVALMVPIDLIGSVHHLVLIYPFPQLFLAASLVSLASGLGRQSPRPALASWGLVLVLTAANARNLMQQYGVFTRSGGSVAWSEAIYALHDYLQSQRPQYVVALQWGIFAQLRFLSKDGLDLEEARQPHRSPNDPIPKLEEWIPRPNSLYVLFTEGQAIPFPEMREVFYETVRRLGYEPQLLATIADRQGRPVYEVLEVKKLGEGSSDGGSPERM